MLPGGTGSSIQSTPNGATAAAARRAPLHVESAVGLDQDVYLGTDRIAYRTNDGCHATRGRGVKLSDLGKKWIELERSETRLHHLGRLVGELRRIVDWRRPGVGVNLDPVADAPTQ